LILDRIIIFTVAVEGLDPHKKCHTGRTEAQMALVGIYTNFKQRKLNHDVFGDMVARYGCLSLRSLDNRMHWTATPLKMEAVALPKRLDHSLPSGGDIPEERKGMNCRDDGEGAR
jgi:hypothetical protein